MRYEAHTTGTKKSVPRAFVFRLPRIEAKGVNSMTCPRSIVFDDAPQDRRLGWPAGVATSGSADSYPICDRNPRTVQSAKSRYPRGFDALKCLEFTHTS